MFRPLKFPYLVGPVTNETGQSNDKLGSIGAGPVLRKLAGEYESCEIPRKFGGEDKSCEIVKDEGVRRKRADDDGKQID